MCTALIVGNVIGIGIFVMPASLAPYGLNAIVGWLITIVGCTFLAITFATFARSFPQDDGPYSYTKRVFGEGAAFVTMWCYWVSTCVTNSTLAIGIVAYLTVFFPALGANHWLSMLTALSLLWLFVLTNMRGARTAGWVQVMATVLKLAPLLGVVVLGVWVLVTHPSAYSQHVPPNPISLTQLTSVSTIALFAMLGIECATIPAGRVRDPQRTIPRATVLGTVITTVIYICVSVVPMLLIPQSELAASNAPFADLFGRLLGAHSGQILALFVIISGLGSLNGWTLMNGELTQVVAKHGRLPAILAKENRHGAPTLAFVVTAGIASVLLVCNYNESIAGIFAFLTVVVTATNLPLYFVCTMALGTLVSRGEIARGEARGTMLAAVAFLGTAYCAWASIGIGVKPLLWAVVLSAIGVPVYWGSGYFRRREAAFAA